MALINGMRALAAMVLLAGATAAYAQAPADTTAPQGDPDAKLVFDREVYSYQGSQRRDPFKPLVGKESLGPLFEDLKLKGIIYASDPARSVALVEDGSGRLYRMRRGDLVGNSRLVEVSPLAARFAVENFGNIRYHILELRSGAAASAGMNTAPPNPTPAAAAPASQQIGNIDFSKLDQATAKRMLDSLAKARREQQGAPR